MDYMTSWLEWYGIKYSYLFLIVLTLAALEVQIEGKHGWMKKIPTWRVKSKIFGFFMGGKELTGYLFYTLLLLILFFHFPFLGGATWSFAAEIEIISLLVLFSVFWDFLWFIINPYYGIKRFKKQYVYWHTQWFLGVPLDYIRGIAVSCGISLIAFPLGFAKWLYALCIFMLGTFVIIGIRRIVSKF
ncbi:hypothetical protein GF369_00260 [Candidatus Peregrinibacteria bacterium]|nr:hypothetical protein [Candidatus Peregrinibacteria bacterium]